MIDINSIHAEVLAAVTENGLNLEHASDLLKGYRSIVCAALKSNPEAKKFVAVEFYLKPENIRHLIYEDVWKHYEDIPSDWQNDKDIIQDLLIMYPDEFNKIPPHLQKDHDFLLELLKEDPKIFPLIPEEVKTKEFVSFILENSCEIRVRDLPGDLRKDGEIVLACPIEFNEDLDSLAPELLESVDFAIKMVNKMPQSYKYIEDFWRAKQINLKEASLLVSLSGIAHHPALYGSEFNPQNDLDLIILAMKVNPLVFNQLSAEQQASEPLIELALDEDSAFNRVCNVSENFVKLRPELQTNPYFALRCLRANHTFLERFDKELLNNQKFLLAALKNNPSLFKRFPESIKNDENFIKEALQTAPSIYNDLTEKQKNLKAIAYLHVKLHPSNYSSLSDSLKSNKEFVKKINEKFPKTKIYTSEGPFIEDPDTDQTWFDDSPLPANDYLNNKLKTKIKISKNVKPTKNTKTGSASDSEESLPNEDKKDLKAAIVSAQKKYAAWFDPKKLTALEKNILEKDGYNRIGAGRSFSFFKDGKLTWFRHRAHGQKQAENLVKSISSIQKDSQLEVWEEINKFLSKANTRYHEHSFASFLIDELKKVEDSPLEQVKTKGKHNRYDKKEVTKEISQHISLINPTAPQV